MDVYAGKGSSLPDVAVIWQVAPISSLHIPPVVVVGRLSVVERYAFPRDTDNLTLHSVKLTAVDTGTYDRPSSRYKLKFRHAGKFFLIILNITSFCENRHLLVRINIKVIVSLDRYSL